MVKYIKSDIEYDYPVYTNTVFMHEAGTVKVELYKWDDDDYEVDVEAPTINKTDYVMNILKDCRNLFWNAESYDEGVRYVDNIVDFLESVDNN